MAVIRHAYGFVEYGYDDEPTYHDCDRSDGCSCDSITRSLSDLGINRLLTLLLVYV